MVALEAKSGATVGGDLFGALDAVERLIPNISTEPVVCGGRARESRSRGEVVPLGDLHQILNGFGAGKLLAP